MDRRISYVILCQDLSNEHVGKNVSAHSSLLSPCALSHDCSSSDTIINILDLVQIERFAVL